MQTEHQLLYKRIVQVGALLLMMIGPTACSSQSRARHFNRSAASAESQSSRVVSELGIKPGQSVADLGSGGGYFTYRLARATGPGGTVYAVDVNRDFLSLIRQGAAERGLKNIRTVLAPPDSSGLAAASVDLVFTRNVYHHLKNRSTYFRKLKAALKPGGRVAVIDYSGDSLLSFVRIFGHATPPDIVQREMQAAGYRLIDRKVFLKSQSFQIFQVIVDQ